MKSIKEQSERASIESFKNQSQVQDAKDSQELDRSQSATPMSIHEPTPMPENDQIPTTPYTGTPPRDAPEDAYRNLHREDSPHS